MLKTETKKDPYSEIVGRHQSKFQFDTLSTVTQQSEDIGNLLIGVRLLMYLAISARKLRGITEADVDGYAGPRISAAEQEFDAVFAELPNEVKSYVDGQIAKLHGES